MNSAGTGGYCTACGAPLTKDAAFCTRCGKPMPANQSDIPQNAPIADTPLIYPQSPAAPERRQESNTMPYEQPMGYTYAAPPRRQAQQRSPTGRLLGLLAFVLLAAAALIIFIVAGFAPAVTIAAAAVVVAAAVVSQVIIKKGFLAGAALWLGALVVCFVLIAVFNPDAAPAGPAGSAATTVQAAQTAQTVSEVHTSVAPSDEDTEVKYGDMTIVIPGGTVQAKEKLDIKPVSDLPQPLEGLTPVCPAFDVTLGNLTAFDAPILINIPYDSGKLGDAEPESGFIAVYWDEELDMWADVPFEVDRENGVVSLQMHHLTTVQLYYSYITGNLTYDTGTVTVTYSNSASQQTSFAAYEKSTGKHSAAGAAPSFVTDLADIANTVYLAYKNEGLSMPGSVNIYLSDSGNSLYKGITGNIIIPADLGAMPSPGEVLQRDVAHEMFHMAQNYTIGWFDFGATSAKNASFWVEATADYMGNTGAWLLLQNAGPSQYTSVSQYQKYNMDFFKESLYTMDGYHEYQAASFVSYLQSVHPVTARQMVDILEKYSAFPSVFSTIYGSSLESSYRDFLDYTLSKRTPGFSNQLNLSIEKDISNKVSLEFKLDDEGNGTDIEPLTGSASLRFSGEYSAGFCVFKTNCDTTMTVTPSSGIVLYMFDRTMKDVGYGFKMDVAGGKATEVKFRKDTFILAAQVSPQAGSISIDYKALPTRTELTGRWSFTQMAETDVEASDAFWALMQESYGYSKSSFLAEMNQEIQESLSSLYLQFTKTGEGQYTLNFVTGDSDATPLDFGVVTIEGNTITASTKFGNNQWASISLTISGNTITGTMRTQILAYSASGNITGTEVFQMTAVHDTPTE